MPLRHFGEKKFGIRKSVFTVAVASLLVSGCNPPNFGAFNQTTTTGGPADQTAQADGAQKQVQPDGPSFAEFRDIPIPANATIDFDDLLVLGAEDGWIGRLALDVGYSMPDMYAFYEREMPRFGWVKITSVRAAISTMTYSRENRIATVTLQSRTTGGTAIDFTVAPTNPMAHQGGIPSTGAGTPALAAPPQSAPTAPVSTPSSGQTSKAVSG